MKWYRSLYLVLFYYFNKNFSFIGGATSKGAGGVFLYSKLVYCVFLFHWLVPKYVLGYTVIASVFFLILDMVIIDSKGVYYTSDNIDYYYKKLENKGCYKIFLLTYLVFSMVIFVWLGIKSGLLIT